MDSITNNKNPLNRSKKVAKMKGINAKYCIVLLLCWSKKKPSKIKKIKAEYAERVIKVKINAGERITKIRKKNVKSRENVFAIPKNSNTEQIANSIGRINKNCSGIIEMSKCNGLGFFQSNCCAKLW